MTSAFEVSRDAWEASGSLQQQGAAARKSSLPFYVPNTARLAAALWYDDDAPQIVIAACDVNSGDGMAFYHRRQGDENVEADVTTRNGVAYVRDDVSARTIGALNIMDFIPYAKQAAVLDFSSTDNMSTYFASAFAAADADRRKLIVPRGKYRFDATATLVDAHYGLDIELDEFAWLQGTANLLNKLWNLQSQTAVRRLRIRGGYFDGSLKPGTGTGSDDLIDITGKWRNAQVREATFYHASHYSLAPAGSGDSAVFATCDGILVTDCFFEGTPDTSVYLSGDTSSSFSQGLQVANCQFRGVISAAGVKRLGLGFVYTGNYHYHCGTGFFTGEADAAPIKLPGKRGIVSNNDFIRMQTAGVSVRWADGTVVVGNLFQDCGYLVDDTTTQVNATGVHLEGSSYCIVADNEFQMGDLAAFGSQRAIWLSDKTLDAVTRSSTHNYIEGNVFNGWRNGYVETDSNQDYNSVEGNAFWTTSTAVTKAGANSRVRGNDGWVTEAKGVATGTTDGSGDLTVTHGLSATPLVVLCNAAGTTFAQAQPNTLGATTFKIRFLDAAGAALTASAQTAYWEARV